MRPDNLLETVLRKLGSGYEYVKFLGEGGFSKVYLIKDSNNSKEYALKIMDYDYHLQLLKKKNSVNIKEELEIIKQRFINEAAFYKDIDHPNIVKIRTFDVIEEVSRGIEVPYLITHFINGKSLKKTIEDIGPLNFKTALNISENILSALNAIHREGVIHRDIKPGNIIIDIENGEAILIDFGLAKDLLNEKTLTVSGQFLGTLPYMSPEQFKEPKGLATTTDVYSFGVVLYEMLAGHRPFEGAEFIDFFNAHQEKEVPNIRSLNTNLPPGIEKILYKAMAKKPGDRYKNAEEFLKSLKELEKVLEKPGKEETEKTEPLSKPKRKWSEYLLLLLISIFIAAAAFIVINPLGIGKKGISPENQYQTYIYSAKRFNQSGDFEKALDELEKAKKIKYTPELAAEIQRILMKKDFQELAELLKREAAKEEKLAACRGFLSRHQNIPANDETKLLVSQTKEFIEQLEEKKQATTPCQTLIAEIREHIQTRNYEKSREFLVEARKVCSTSESVEIKELEKEIDDKYGQHISEAERLLKKKEFELAYENLEWAKSAKTKETQETKRLEIKIYAACISACEEYLQMGNHQEAEKTLLVAQKINPKRTHQELEDVIAVSSKAKTVKKQGKFWEANFDDGIVMIYIPAGEFLMGEGMRSKSSLPGYWLGKTEVSVGQYMKFVKEKGTNFPEWNEEGSPYHIVTGRDNYYNNQVEENFPIVGISWDDAAAYCQWLSRKTGLRFKLPTEAQWEKAARGTDGRLYPWGGEKPGNHLANFFSPSNKTVKVNSHTQGASPYGLLNMAGNVEEWCDNQYARGGNFYSNERYIRCTARNKYDSKERNHALGFRLCMVNYR